jgi:hypothetical protein
LFRGTRIARRAARLRNPVVRAVRRDEHPRTEALAYSLASRTVSEPSAIGAPTRPLRVPLGTPYTVLDRVLVRAFGASFRVPATSDDDRRRSADQRDRSSIVTRQASDHQHALDRGYDAGRGVGDTSARSYGRAVVPATFRSWQEYVILRMGSRRRPIHPWTRRGRAIGSRRPSNDGSQRGDVQR